MGKDIRVEMTGGNTPVGFVPGDYMPAGAGRWMVLPQGRDAGKKMFFYEQIIGAGEPEQTVVFVHGNPESSYTWRKTIDALAAQAPCCCRIVAMDHIGFGLSDQASFEMVDMHHSDNLKQLIRHLDLQKATLVIHDWGGPIGVGAFIDEPERVANLVVVNTTVFPLPMKPGLNFMNYPVPVLMSWNLMGKIIPARLWRYVTGMAMTSPVGPWPMIKHFGGYLCRSLVGATSEKEILYRDMFVTRANALSSKRNVKQTIVWGHGYRYFEETQGWQDNSAYYRNMQTRVPFCWGPDGQNIGVRGFWGEWDPCAKPAVRRQWCEALPQLEGHISTYPNVGHFSEEVVYDDIAAGIAQLLE
jgi:pimeloyl-ACP methyl ester carboxylesterase